MSFVSINVFAEGHHYILWMRSDGGAWCNGVSIFIPFLRCDFRENWAFFLITSKVRFDFEFMYPSLNRNFDPSSRFGPLKQLGRWHVYFFKFWDSCLGKQFCICEDFFKWFAMFVTFNDLVFAQYISFNLGSLYSIGKLWAMVMKAPLFPGLYVDIFGSILWGGVLLCWTKTNIPFNRARKFCTIMSGRISERLIYNNLKTQ